MANQIFWFPSQTGYYSIPAGQLRIAIYYDDGTTLDNTDTNADIVKMSKLSIPLETDPSSQGFRHSTISIDFHNYSYDATNNIFEQLPILNNSYSHKTYIKIYIGGSEVWHGIIDYDQTKRHGYYLDGSTLKYRYLSIKAYDALYYFWQNQETLTTIGYSNGDTLLTTWEDIRNRIGASNAVQIDSNIRVEEECGNNYATNFLRSTGIGSMLVQDFIKQFLLGFGTFVFNYNSYYRLVRRIGGTTKTITIPFIRDQEIIENANAIGWIRLRNDRDWSGECDDVSTYIHSHSAGVLAQKNYDVYLSGLIEYIYINYGTAANYAPGTPPSGGTQNYLDDTTHSAFYTEEIESGMVVEYYTNAMVQQNRNILYVSGVSRVWHPNDGSTGKDTLINNYFIEKNPNGVDDLFKIHKILEKTVDELNEFFRTSPNIMKIYLRDISEFPNLHYKFILSSLNYRARNINIDFMKDELDMELVRVT